jgi:DNA-binding response OmpR family regulator
MLTDKDLRKLEVELYDIGIAENVRTDIRNSKICIIDNEIDDLKSLHDGLKREGFNNLTKYKASPTIHQLLSSHYDIIVLDLNDVANKITEEDGIGVLRLLKENDPSLPILVVTGQKISPEVNYILNRADLIRKKPVLAADLANDVETILKIYRDKYWASLTLLKELNKIDIELMKELSIFKRYKLHTARKSLEKKLVRKEDDIIDKLEKILKIIKHCSSITANIGKLTTAFLSNA